MVAKASTAKAPVKKAAVVEGVLKIFARGEMIAERAFGKAEKTYLASLSKEGAHWPQENRRIVLELPNAPKAMPKRA